MRSKKLLLLFYTLGFGFLFLSLFLIYYLVYRIHISHLYGYKEVHCRGYVSPEFPPLSRRQALNLGWAHPVFPGRKDDIRYPASSYLNFPQDKPDSVFRIGCFGDSFTEGTEAGYGYDFPSFLQDIFYRYGHANVEVINFGVGSYGVHQSYLLFHYLQKIYQLDLVLMFPTSGHPDRDNRFIYGLNYTGVHARFILDADSLKLIHVKGDNREEATRIYHRFFEYKPYLIYEIKTPNFLKPLIPGEFNPFYYTGAKKPEDTYPEMFETYRLLFHRWRKEAHRLAIITTANSFMELANVVDSLPCYYIGNDTFMDESASLYRAECGHFSPFGNYVLASQVFSILTGDTLAIPVFRLQPPDTILDQRKEVQDVRSLENASVEIQEIRIERLFYGNDKDKYNICLNEWDVQDSEEKNLLMVLPDAYTLLLIPAPPFDDGTGVYMQSGKSEFQAGRIKRLNPYIQYIQWNQDKVPDYSRHRWKVAHFNDHANQEGILIIQNWQLPLNFEFLDGSMYRIHFNPRNFVTLKLHGDQYFDLSDPDRQTGIIYFNADINGETHRFPMLRWRIDHERYVPRNSNAMIPFRPTSE